MTGSSGNPQSEIRSPNSDFDWRVFADATCAGLAVLIPLPLVDMAFEALFRRRIPGAIARARGRSLGPELHRDLGRTVERPGSLRGCLALGAAVVRFVVKRIFRKIVYILSIRDAASALAAYWHRAFLIDHMLRAGHLEPAVDTELAVRVFRQTVRATDPEPLTGLAKLTVANAHHVLRLLVAARSLGAAKMTRQLGVILGSHWDAAEASLAATAGLYDRLYRSELERRAATAAGGPERRSES
jgi:hypothetical protein